MDFESFLDFVLALENRDTPEGLTYLFKCLDLHRRDTSQRLIFIFYLVVRVQDETGSTSFVLFDRQLSKIINKSVAWLATQIEKTDDPFLLPDDFNVLLNKEMVFKIAVGEFNLRYDYSTYTVHRATDDADVMNAITKKIERSTTSACY